MPIGRYSSAPSSYQQELPSEPKQDAQPQHTKQFQWHLTNPKHKLSDMVLSDETRNEILDVISYFQNENLIMNQWGLAERFGDRRGLAVNLYGPSGTGKTMAAHAIIQELMIPMICVDYAEIESKYVGETSKNLSALFKAAKENQAAIFFDEADALLSKRVTNMTSATDVSVNQTRSVLLNLLNDYSGVIIFASNFIQNYDVAFLRRIQFHIEFHLPDEAQRRALWQAYIPEKMPCSPDIDVLAAKYDAVSGSDIANAVFSAAVSAAREKKAVVTQHCLELSIERIRRVKDSQHGGITVIRRTVSAEEMKSKLNSQQDSVLHS